MIESSTVGRRLTFVFGLAVIMLVVVGGVGYRTTDTLITNDHEVARTHVAMETLTRVLSLAKDAETGARGFLLTGDDTYLVPFRAAVAALPTAINDLRRLMGTDAEQAHRIEELSQAIDGHMAELSGVVSLRRIQGFEAADKRISLGEGKKNMDRIRSLATAMEFDQRQLLEQRAARADSSAGSAKITLLASAAGAVFLVGLLGAVILRTLNRQLGGATADIRSCATELEAAAQQQATGSRQQATAASEVSTTILELLATSRQIADSAQRVSRMTAEAAGGARGGAETVQRAQEAINGIKRQVDVIVEHMLELGKKSQQAGVILELVNELAEQTNILAINASIEAAGAGESGRRFGVVADEIRKLADRVGASTKEIRRLLTDIRSAVNTTVMATETGTKAVEAGTRQFGEVTASFKGIVGLATTTNEAAREIELSTKQQSTGVEQVNQAIVSVAQTTRELEASTSQTLQTARQLTVLSRDIARIVQAKGA